MTYRYSGLSAQQVMENRQRFGENIIGSLVSIPRMEKLRQVSTFWLIRVLEIVGIVTCFVLLLLDIFLSALPLVAGLIVPLLMGVLLLVYWVVYMVGHWNVEKKRQELNSMMTALLVVLVIVCLIAYYSVIVLGGSSVLLLVGVGAAVGIVVVATGIIYLQERRVIHRHLVGSDARLFKVIRDDACVLVLSSELVVGDVVCLEIGDEVPADVELLECNELVVDESAVMGSRYSCKSVDTEEDGAGGMIASNQVLKGSVVLSGSAIAEVFAVGKNTMVANIKTQNPQWHWFSANGRR